MYSTTVVRCVAIYSQCSSTWDKPGSIPGKDSMSSLTIPFYFHKLFLVLAYPPTYTNCSWYYGHVCIPGMWHHNL